MSLYAPGTPCVRVKEDTVAYRTMRAQNQVEDTIANKELNYLDSTPAGNIITGFDNYMKGQSAAAAQRRKAGPVEQNRVFSKSSISYRPNNAVRMGSDSRRVLTAY